MGVMSDPRDDYFRAKQMLATDAEGERRQGVELLRILAEGGHARAQFRLGLLYARGEAGVLRDEGLAARWCAAAARQGLGKAQFNLGLMHAGGHGVDHDTVAAERWLRLASANGVDEAEQCLELVHDDATRPSTWQDADTRASVALACSGPDSPKRMRFAEYYVDPCINILVSHLQLSREQGEDIVQQFMLELEEPLSKGEHQGRVWKESLRMRFVAGREQGHRQFRPYLFRVLVNFARDWQRRQRREIDQPRPVEHDADPTLVAEHHADEWRALLVRFTATAEAQAGSRRAVQVLGLLLGAGLDQTEISKRLEVSSRTVRSDLRLGSELLITWLEASLAEAGLADDPALVEGMRQLPDWLHYPVGIKRVRVLLFLALSERRIQGVHADRSGAPDQGR